MNVTDEDLKIQIHHIGGIAECGPVDVLGFLKESINWTFYDADKASLDNTDVKDKNYTLINKCIGGEDKKAKFNILANPSASSVLLPAKSAEQYVISTEGEKVVTWGEHTKFVKAVEVELHKLDTLLKNKEINPIDFLSIDAQGLDYDVIKGTENNIDDVLGVLCETEFTPLYEGQKLFSDIDTMLRGKGFRLCILYNPQYFPHMTLPSHKKGQGFLTVGESLFLRDPTTLYERFYNGMSEKELTKLIIQCIKLAVIGMLFNQPDFSYDIIKRLEMLKLINIKEFAKLSKHSYFKMFEKLLDGTLKLKFKRWEDK